MRQERKKFVLKKIILVNLFVFFCISQFFLVSALRVTPAIIKINFKPNFEGNPGFSVTGQTDNKLELFIEGDLEEYMTLSKDSLPNTGGDFSVHIKLPEELDRPGKHITYVGVREKPDEELLGGAIGTAVVIKSVIAVYVPYPGKYLETELKAHDANIGEPITFQLSVRSMGDENLIMKPTIEIYTEKGELVDTLYFREREIKSKEAIDLKKVLDTNGYVSGNYYAVSKVYYDDFVSESKTGFRIGELSVKILNYTKRIPIEGIQKFLVKIESGWNDRIDGAYAEVTIFNKSYEDFKSGNLDLTNSKILTKFRTSPTDLNPWQSETILGYVDTNGFVPGNYSSDITIIYYGRDKGKSTSEIVNVEFYEKESDLFFYLLAGGIPLTLILIMLILFFLTRKKS